MVPVDVVDARAEPEVAPGELLVELLVLWRRRLGQADKREAPHHDLHLAGLLDGLTRSLGLPRSSPPRDLHRLAFRCAVLQALRCSNRLTRVCCSHLCCTSLHSQQLSRLSRLRGGAEHSVLESASDSRQRVRHASMLRAGLEGKKAYQHSKGREYSPTASARTMLISLLSS